jgi:nitrogen-specific signal transduction histidine kinase
VAVAVANARLFEEVHAHEAAATRAYQDLKAAQDQLVRAEKLRALGEMASGVAHDFNNVLAAILGRVQLILRRVEDPTLRQWLSIVERAALDGAKIVRQLQEFTHIRRDRPTQTVDVNAVVEDAVEMTRTRWRDDTRSRGVDIRLVVELTPGPPVDGHPAELGEALMNLILNAVDALPEGGTITAATRPASDGGVLVSVADTGVGMSEAVRGRIFEPFFSTKGLRGTGLGLAMVYGIVSRHGGEVTVESTEGAGSTFTIHLPPGRLRSTEVSWPPALRSEGTARVLVIDDEPHVREILAEILRVQKHEVVEAGLGVEGLIRFRERSFDLVMTDLAMPGMSGWQVAQAIKAERPEVPVVLVTGWGVEVPPDQLRQNGVDRVMTKPFRFEDVRDVVASFRPKR